jgi:hypothetical protein
MMKRMINGRLQKAVCQGLFLALYYSGNEIKDDIGGTCTDAFRLIRPEGNTTWKV